MKFPYYKPLGYPEGMYRWDAGADQPGGKLRHATGQQEWIEFRALERGGVEFVSLHYARLIEILFALEHMEEYLLDPIITKSHARYSASLIISRESVAAKRLAHADPPLSRG